jgi:preprotein translocase subunit SecE
VARDRKRAKQRRARQGAASTSRENQRASTPASGTASGGAGGVQRADLPGALEHAGDVDEFDAALVMGAGGIAAEPDAATEAELQDEAETESRSELESERDLGEDLLQTDLSAGGADGSGNGRPPTGEALEERPSGAPLRGGNRAIGFLRASWAELQRVQWPDRRHVFQATAVVLGFVAVAGLYLGLADYVAKEIVEFIL